MNILKKNLYVIFINLILLIFFIYIISKSILLCLDIYTKHNNYVIIPDILNLDIKTAKKHLDNLDLYYEIDSSNYNPKFFPYRVITFAPQAGDIVKPGRTVFIQVNAANINKRNIKYIKLPNIFFQKKYYALRILYSQHFIIRNISYIPNINKDVVLKVIYNKKYINSGDIIPYNSTLDLIISSSSEDIKNNSIVPNFYGMNFFSSKKLLYNKKFVLGNIFYDQIDNIDTAIVYHQEPAAGSKIYNGDSINLWLSKNLDIKELNLKNNENKKKFSLKNDQDKFYKKNEIENQPNDNKEILE